METIYADQTISISEFKTNPDKMVAEAQGRPLAVLINNKPAFYAVPSELFKQIADILDDFVFANSILDRVADGQFDDVDLEDL